MTLLWLVFDDQYKYFSKGTLVLDFERKGELVWPTTGLFRVPDRMRSTGVVDS